MKRSTKLGIIITLICLVFTIWQIPKANEVLQLYNSAELLNEAEGVFGEEFRFPQETQDKETVEIASALISDPSIPELAELVSQYPQNEFFLCELVQSLLTEDDLDPQAIQLLVNKLISLNPQNGHYHYLKAYTRIEAPHPNLDNSILRTLEYANSLEFFALSLSPYQERLNALLDSANIHPIQRIQFESTEYWIYYTICRYLNDEIRRTVSDSNEVATQRLFELGTSICNTLFQNAQTRGDMFSACIYWGCPESR